MDGLCYQAGEALSDWLGTHMESEHGFEHAKENVQWLANLTYGYKNHEDGWIYAMRGSLVCQLVTAISMEVLWEIEIEHIKDEKITGYNAIEQIALMAYYQENLALKSGKMDEQDKADMSEILCYIGEAALELEKTYAVDILRVAAEMGSDYAAVVMSRPMIFDAVRSGASKEARESSLFFKDCLKRVEKVAGDSKDERRQAHALLALGVFYEYGAGVEKNVTTACRYMQKAADMQYPFASHMLELYEKMPNGEYRRKSR
jgi:hypothetical protein